MAIAVRTKIASNTSVRPIANCGSKSVPRPCSRHVRLMHDTSPQATVASTAPTMENVAGNDQR